MMPFKFIQRLLLSLLFIALSGCGGGGSSTNGTDTSTDTSSNTVAVTGFAGPFISGTATAFKITSGQKGDQLAVASLDANGRATLDIGDYTGVFQIEIIGEYIDEATGNTFTITADAPLIALFTGTSADIEVAVTPLTHIAQQYARSLGVDKETILEANKRIAELLLGDEELDLLTIIPVDATTAIPEGTATLRVIHGQVLAAISQGGDSLLANLSNAIIQNGDINTVNDTLADAWNTIRDTKLRRAGAASENNDVEASNTLFTKLRRDRPKVRVGRDQSVRSAETVRLTASLTEGAASIASIVWTHVDASDTTQVTLKDASTQTASFIAPNVSTPTKLKFNVLVTDSNGLKARDHIRITINPASSTVILPVADAGNSQSVNEGALVTLNSAASSHDPANVLTRSWTQLSGLGVTLSSSSAILPTFTAPEVDQQALLVFGLDITDSEGNRSVDTTVVLVNDTTTTGGDSVLDTDNDNIPNDIDPDDDNDGVSDVDEIANGTNPLLADSDGDQVNDDKDEFPLDNTKATSIEKAHRLLVQASFGATRSELDSVVATGIEAWVDQQLSASSAYDNASDHHQSHLQRTIEIALAAEPTQDWSETTVFNKTYASFRTKNYQLSAWWENALGHPSNTEHGQDQLRQRVAYALSQLLVASVSAPPLHRRGEGLAFYYDLLAKHAFGNYRDLLGDVARSPTMGIFLSHQGNKKADPSLGVRPDENFARELIQLFTIGLIELNVDGSPNYDADPNSIADSGSTLVPTYTQTDVEELAKVMTGWDLVSNNRYGNAVSRQGDYTQAMEFTASEHEDEVAEGGDGQVTVLGHRFALNSGSDQSGLDAALDIIFAHPNLAPFVSRHLIVRLVTSNPTPAYVGRVAAVFNDNGRGIKGDLKAVVRAILLDDEARNLSNVTNTRFGKAKEPLLAYTQFLRAFNVQPLEGWLSTDKMTKINGVYQMNTPANQFGQGPLRSPSVFNFYSRDFIPSDAHFSANQLVAPELEIQTDQILVELNNIVLSQVKTYEKNKITRVDNKTLAEFAVTQSTSKKSIMLIDFDTELALFERTLDGDSNGDFSNMEATDSDGIRFKAKAVDALLIHLDRLLLGNTMTIEYRAAVKHYLMNARGTRNNNDFIEAREVIKDAVRFIVTSSSFMIQK